jgi:hypothetical protein
MTSVIAAGEASITLRSSWCVFHWFSSSAAWRSWPAQLGDQRDHAGVDAGHQPVGFLPLGVAHQQPFGAAGDVGHVRAQIQDQIQAGTQPIPP